VAAMCIICSPGSILSSHALKSSRYFIIMAIHLHYPHPIQSLHSQVQFSWKPYLNSTPFISFRQRIASLFFSPANSAHFFAAKKHKNHEHALATVCIFANTLWLPKVVRLGFNKRPENQRILLSLTHEGAPPHPHPLASTHRTKSSCVSFPSFRLNSTENGGRRKEKERKRKEKKE